MIKLLKILIIVNLLFLKGNSYLQGVKVEGRILCKKTPVKNLEILLKDEDIFFDDVLAKGATDKNGYFVLFGKTFELSKISPYIQMTWTCPENYIPSHYDDMKFYVSENATIYYYNYYRYYYNFGEIDLYNFINDLYQFPKKYV